MKKVIDEFLEQKHIAIAGVSRNKNKWGNNLMRELKKKNIRIYPVNPYADELEGEKCYHTLSKLPFEAESLIIATKPKDTEKLVKQIPGSGIKRVWMQKGGGAGSASISAIEYCIENNIPYVYGFCPMMFFGKGVHRFHFWLRKNFGKIPAEFS